MINLLKEKNKYNKEDIVSFLKLTDPIKLNYLYKFANDVRTKYVGDTVHIRGIIEFSNFCCRNCLYCGIRKSNTDIQRYRMTEWEILQTAKKAHKDGYQTVILQSGEDFTFTTDKIVNIIKQIKDETGMFVTLSLGERSYDDYQKFKDAGGDRYLLKHETSDPILYRNIHPDLQYSNRIKCLKNLKEIGFEIGSGIMVGLPGQTFESIANDILLFKELDADMIGLGPYIPHPKTPLSKKFDQIGGYFTPATGFYNVEEMVLKIYAITRIVTKTTNIPATTALTTINKHKGREIALNCGANVVMLNITDEKYSKLYEIYPDKVNNIQKAQDLKLQTEQEIYKIGRKPL